MGSLFLIMGIAIIILIIVIFFIWRRLDDYESRTFWLKGIELIIIFILVSFVSNELIAPLFNPRVTDINIIPLYIQSQQPSNWSNPINYYVVFEVNYEIEPPYFPPPLGEYNLNLRLPGERTSEAIDLIIPFQENNNYYSINLPKIFLDGINFLPYEKINGLLPIKLLVNYREIKKIHAKVIIRELLDLHDQNLEKSDPYWWTRSTVYPIKTTGDDFTKSISSRMGVGRNQKGDYYQFYDIIIKSNSDLEIKGIYIPAVEGRTYCYEGIELAEYDQYVSIDLAPKELKHILSYSKISDENIENKTDFIFDFKSETYCHGQWLKFQELIDNK